MDITITPHKLHGKLRAIPSKSQAHRLLICAAFSDKQTVIHCPETNQDIEATASCLQSLGAVIKRTQQQYIVQPITAIPRKTELNCGESGSTLRFMLPIVGALGVDTTFLLAGRLPHRPLSPLWEEMERHGCTLYRPTENTIRCSGQLRSGRYNIDGSVSSQFITGLLFALTLLPGDNTLKITGTIESKSYIDMTQNALLCFGINTTDFTTQAAEHFISPGDLMVEGDWSNGAFFLSANHIGNDVDLIGLNPSSAQGDRIVVKLLDQLTKTDATIDAANIPDLVPILSVVAAAKHGATFTNIRRLRLKESDRVASVCQMLSQLGINTDAQENILRVFPGHFHSCTINSFVDHRIAMSAAIAATCADGPVTITDAQCVSKSYPTFWDEYRRLGGQYEQYIR